MDTSLMPKVFTNHHNWYSSFIDSLKYTNPASFHNYQSSPSLIIYTYDHAFGGFCALLSSHELEALRKSLGFISAYRDSILTLDTTYTLEFLSLNPSTGLWPTSKYGKDVIVGVIDSGVWPESESFNDEGMLKKLPEKWNGTYEVGQNFNSSSCNAKDVIGARYFNKGVISKNPNITISMNSARDTRGHGTYSASIVAGNYVNGATFFGYAFGVAKGVAPRARLAIYKVSWDEGTYTSDAVAAMKQAISDGVDVISLSMDNPKKKPLHKDPLARASFGAMEKGVLVSTSAGNYRGTSNQIISNDYPWVLTATAGTIDRWYARTLALENGMAITGWTIFFGNASRQNLPLVYDKSRMMCDKVFSDIPYGIIICNGYLPISKQIENIVWSNPLGAVFIVNNSISSEIESIPDTPCPCMLITSIDAVELLEFIESTQTPLANMTFFPTIVGMNPAPAVAASALRGPSQFPGILLSFVLILIFYE